MKENNRYISKKQLEALVKFLSDYLKKGITLLTLCDDDFYSVNVVEEKNSLSVFKDKKYRNRGFIAKLLKIKINERK